MIFINQKMLKVQTDVYHQLEILHTRRYIYILNRKNKSKLLIYLIFCNISLAEDLCDPCLWITITFFFKSTFNIPT